MKTYMICFRTNHPASAKSFALHAEGCGDVEKEKNKYGAHADKVVALTTKAAVAAVLAGDLADIGYTRADIQVLPCCSRGPQPANVADPSICSATGQKFPNLRGDMYLPCPVCGTTVATGILAGRGTVPRHKRRA